MFNVGPGLHRVCDGCREANEIESRVVMAVMRLGTTSPHEGAEQRQREQQQQEEEECTQAVLQLLEEAMATTNACLDYCASESGDNLVGLAAMAGNVKVLRALIAAGIDSSVQHSRRYVKSAECRELLAEMN
eukprot:COSAG01_NODE_17287_length_1163_cov_2.052632_2_plen_132_part_00